MNPMCSDTSFCWRSWGEYHRDFLIYRPFKKKILRALDCKATLSWVVFPCFESGAFLLLKWINCFANRYNSIKGYVVSNRWLSVFTLLLSFYRTYQLYRHKMSPLFLGERNIGKWTDLLRLGSFRMIRIRINDLIIMHQEWTRRFLWCTMIRVISDHWTLIQMESSLRDWHRYLTLKK